ncbi:hypothetical protein Tco_0720152 [Tanacetum coccineum]
MADCASHPRVADREIRERSCGGPFYKLLGFVGRLGIQDVLVVVISVGFCYDWLLGCNYGKGFLDLGGRGSNHRKKQGLTNEFTIPQIDTTGTMHISTVEPHSIIPVMDMVSSSYATKLCPTSSSKENL